MEKKETCCLGKILKVIDILQRNAGGNECFDEGCTKPFLGNRPRVMCFNTRPVTFYTRNGCIFTANYYKTSESSTFRVESVDDCCVKCRILKRNKDSCSRERAFVATDEFITINLDCICAISCLDDVIIDNL